MNASESLNLSWDLTVKHIHEILTHLRKEEGSRAKRQQKRVEKRRRAKIRSLCDLAVYSMRQHQRQQHEKREEFVLKSGSDSNGIFKRISQRDQNQPVTRVKCSEANRNTTVADCMAHD